MISNDALEFAIVLYEEILYSTPYKVATLAADLMKAARQTHLHNERACNGYADARGNWDETAANKDEKRQINRQKRIAAMLEPYGIKAKWGGDPRGAALQLILPRTKRTNGWGNEGYCVPER